VFGYSGTKFCIPYAEAGFTGKKLLVNHLNSVNRVKTALQVGGGGVFPSGAGDRQMGQQELHKPQKRTFEGKLMLVSWRRFLEI
jgi:hypothetical protein